jgi:aryl-phospho-beta-D-glucosidase BglC (GH1 family)
MAIASVAGARHWGTRPTDDDLIALLRNEMTLLRSPQSGTMQK